MAGLSDRTRDVIADTARRYADDEEEAALMSERLSIAVARRIRRAAEATKQCVSCWQVLSVSDFHKNPNSTDGMRSKCKACHKSNTQNRT